MAEEATIHRGLDGVVVDSTRISKVMPEINSLVYFGYPVQELAEHCCFEEVAWLLWHGELPNAQQLAAFQADGRSRRHLSKELLTVIRKPLAPPTRWICSAPASALLVGGVGVANAVKSHIDRRSGRDRDLQGARRHRPRRVRDLSDPGDRAQAWAR